MTKTRFSTRLILNSVFNIQKTLTMKTMSAIAFIVLLTLSVQPAISQIPAPVQSQPVALTGGTIHTMAGDVIENGTILFEKGKITAVGTDVTIPSGAVRENVTGKHIYPGLIDSWSQMGLYEIGAVSMTVDINEQGPINPNVRAERAFNAESRHIGVARSAGVLTAVSSPGGGLISGQSAAMMLEGWSWEEMTLKPGVGLIVNWPNPRSTNYQDQLRQLRSTFADAKAYHKAKQAMVNGNGPRIDFDSRWESMIPVISQERPVVVNAGEVRQIQDAITWSTEEEVRLIILGGNDAHLVSEHLKSRNIPVILTSVLSSPFRSWQAYDAAYSLPAKLHEAGVRFSIAGGASAPNANRLPHEAGAAIAYGLPSDAALEAVTSAAAEILGLDDHIGSLETGKDATLIITDGNPIEYATQIEQVYIQGRKSDMMDNHKQLYEKFREKVDQRQAE
ncbi:imidazolonepropionase [Rhodohalobacter mucosus]|uniref:Imidazolonepropionase n=2 Tax=Rhodohalobacter mucosus TaxID=2079485 RepID=A0A316TUE9_9BACT|nr:imidazolonepropionase [Rhodohalobacter mucosus]